MSYEELKAELTNDPAGIGYAGKTDKQASDLVNAKSQRGPVPIVVLSALCLKIGIIGKCEVQLYQPIAEGDTVALDIARLASSTLTLLRDDYRLETCDVDDEDFVESMDAFIGLGWITTEQKNAVLSLGNNRRSRAEIIGGDGTRYEYWDVARARALGA